MKIDTNQLLVVFEDLLPLTNEGEGTYWFKTVRDDGLVVTLTVSLYEAKVAITINDPETTIVNLRFGKCVKINVLDEDRKCLEVLYSNGSGRCFLSLLKSPILDCEE